MTTFKTLKDIWDTKVDIASPTTDAESKIKEKSSRKRVNANNYVKNAAKIKENYRIRKNKKMDLNKEIKKLLDQLPETILLNNSEVLYFRNKKYKFTYILQNLNEKRRK